MLNEALTAYAAGKAAVSTLSAIAKADAAFDKAELKLKLAGVATQILELMDANQKLREQIENLQHAAKIKGEVILKGDSYFVKNDGREDGPFCTRCVDVDGRLVRIAPNIRGVRECPQCKRTLQRE